MLLVLVWGEADDLNLLFSSHCRATTTGEVFLRVHEPDDPNSIKVPYRVVEAGGGCEIQDSTIWANRFDADNWPVTLKGTSLSATTTAGTVSLTDTAWDGPPSFAASRSQALLARMPQVLFGFLLFAGMLGCIAHHIYQT